MSTVNTNEEKHIKKEINQFINSNMPKIESHGGSFAIYEINLVKKYIRIKFAGSCTTCIHSHYKFDQLMNRIPNNFEHINTVEIEFV